MPSKKSHNHVGADKENKVSHRPSSPLFKEGSDPIETVVSIVDKRARNLSKRKERLTSLQKEGKNLDKDQLDAISKLPDILVQIEFLHEMQKQFADLNTEYQKHQKSLQKSEEKKKKEEERSLQKMSYRYCLRMQLLLDQIDDTTKEAFRNGSDGAVKLSDTELQQLDDFYSLVHPLRAGNTNFENELSSAVQHMLLVHEESSAKVAGTTYKNIHSILNRIDSCGYLDKEPPSPPPSRDDDIDDNDKDLPTNSEVLDEYDGVSSSFEVISSQMIDEIPNTTTYTGYTHDNVTSNLEDAHGPLVTTPTKPAIVGTPTFGEPTLTDSTHQHMPISAPSPDFIGLGEPSKLSSSLDFQFTRSDTQPAATALGSFPTTFGNTENMLPVERDPTHLNRDTLPPPTVKSDGQYVPETGQQIDNKSDLIGQSDPVVTDNVPVGSGGKMSKNDSSDLQSSKPNSYTRSYDNRRGGPRSNGSNRQRGNFSNGGNRPYYSREGGNNYGGNGYNRGMGGGKPRGGGGGNRGRPNYNFSRPPMNQQRNNGGPRNNSRPSQSYNVSTQS